jgi:hypothetical protein
MNAAMPLLVDEVSGAAKAGAASVRRSRRKWRRGNRDDITDARRPHQFGFGGDPFDTRPRDVRDHRTEQACRVVSCATLQLQFSYEEVCIADPAFLDISARIVRQGQDRGWRQLAEVESNELSGPFVHVNLSCCLGKPARQTAAFVSDVEPEGDIGACRAQFVRPT